MNVSDIEEQLLLTIRIEELEKELAKANARLSQLRENKRFTHEQRSNEFEKPAEQAAPSFSHIVQSDNSIINTEVEHLNTLMNVVLDNLPVYIFMKDVNDDFRYVYWNATFANLSGASPGAVIGKNDYEIFLDREDMDRFRADDIRTVKEKRIEFIERYFAANSQERVVKTIKTLVECGESSYIIGLSWDITDIKRGEEELILARVKAEESDKLKSAFLSNMSHEIRTPLNAIVGFSKLIADCDVKTEQIKYADIVTKNSALLLNIFNDIFDLSALEAGTMDLSMSYLQIWDISNNLYSNFYSKIGDNVELILDDCDKELTIEGDWKRILQVGSHLLSNALKFTREGKINFGYRKQDDKVLFYVKDTGIGLTNKQANTIFHRFDKVDAYVQGNGLGLPICRMLVEKMGGEIWLHSTIGKGSTFYFTIPFKPNIASRV